MNKESLLRSVKTHTLKDKFLLQNIDTLRNSPDLFRYQQFSITSLDFLFKLYTLSDTEIKSICKYQQSLNINFIESCIDVLNLYYLHKNLFKQSLVKSLLAKYPYKLYLEYHLEGPCPLIVTDVLKSLLHKENVRIGKQNTFSKMVQKQDKDTQIQKCNFNFIKQNYIDLFILVPEQKVKFNERFNTFSHYFSDCEMFTRKLGI